MGDCSNLVPICGNACARRVGCVNAEDKKGRSSRGIHHVHFHVRGNGRQMYVVKADRVFLGEKESAGPLVLIGL